MTFFESVIQGIIQGATEFLPVSSSGHLSVFQHFTGIEGNDAVLSTIVMHLGTLLAVFAAFRQKITALVKEFFGMLKSIFTGKFKYSEMNGNQRMIVMIIVSILPLFVFYIFKDMFLQISADDDIIAEGICFLYTAALLAIADKNSGGNLSAGETTAGTALTIGAFQGVALLPGVSRSGSTISAALLMGMKREDAVEYSFILGIPVILAGAVTEIGDIGSSSENTSFLILLVGFVSSAVTGYFAIRLLNWLVKTNKFKIFSIYTGLLGIVVIILGILEHTGASVKCVWEVNKLSGTKKNTAAARSSSSKRSSSSRSKAAQKNQNDKVLWSIVFFAAAVLVFAFSAVKGDAAWLSVHNFILGMFGKAVFILPVIMIYTSFMIAGDKTGEHIKGKISQGIILVLLICGMLRIFSDMVFPAEITLMRRFSELYESGKDLVGGGLMSIFLGETLLGIFGKTGAAIIIVILVIAWACLLFNKTVFDIFRLVGNLFESAVNARDEYEETVRPERQKRTKKSSDDGFKAPPGAEKKKAVPVPDEEEEILKNQENFNVDISIPSAPVKKSKKEKQKEETSEEADIIARTIAANESAKAAAKAAAAAQKQKADSAKDDMKNASGELDDIIRKAALSGRKARQDKEAVEDAARFGSVISPVKKKTEEQTETSAPTAENTAAEVQIAPAPVQSAPVTAPVRNTPPPALQENRRKSFAVQKSSTLASNKITDDEDLDMQAMTAKDIQNEINAEEKAVFEYHFPPIELLRESHNDVNAENAEAEMKSNADILVNTLKSFGVMTRIVDIHRGPTVTRYELQPSAGVKISKITNLSDDIALNLAAEGVRIEAPIPGKAAVGIEVPNRVKDTVTMRDVISSEEFKNAKSKLTFAVGKNIDGEIVLGDISKLPHVIIAGTTGSGKSVCTNGIIMSILYNATPDEVRLVLIDPKVVEFKIYDGIPHLLIPVVTDPRKAAGALAWAVQEMLKRYKLFADRNVRDINGYNEKAQETEDMDPLPRIVIVIDELADLMMAAAGEVEDSICRLAQMARAAGMHLIIATQRPTVDVITGLIKANIPSRIALKVASGIDSRAILNEIGAEKLLGQGDMLYFPTSFAKPVRVQNCFTSDKEVGAVVDYIKNGAGDVLYDESIMNEIESNIPVPKGEKPADNGKTYEGSDEDLIERAIECVVDNGTCSTSYLQRKLKLGYARAARIVDELEEMGIVGPQEGAKQRQVLMSRESYLQRKLGTAEAVTYYDNTPSSD